MQIGFNVWQKVLECYEINNLYYSFYIFFMYGSCFIVLKVIINHLLIFFLIYIQKQKLYSSLQKLYEWINKNKVNLTLCKLAEKAIINYCPNQTVPQLDSPSLFIDTIYNQILKFFFSSNNENLKDHNGLYDKIMEFKNTSITILQFALCEYDIYSEFNQIIIALASCLISLKENENKKIINKNIYQNFIDILSNLKYDFSLIEKCKNKILEILNSEDNSNENNKNEEILGFEFLNNHMISFVKIIENYWKS